MKSPLSESRDAVFEQVLSALHNLIPIIDQIKDSIEDTSSSIPRASKQLANVSQATETATVEILNVVEGMTQSISEAEQALGKARSASEGRTAATMPLRTHLDSLKREFPDDQRIKDLAAYFETSAGDKPEIPAYDTIGNCLTRALEDSMRITMALQVQDITSQQIAGALHLIEGVRTQLLSTVKHAEEGVPTPDQDRMASILAQKTHFDSNASYSTTPDRQEDADEIIRQWQNGQQALPTQ